MATVNNTASERDFYTSASVFDMLANAARAAAPKVFDESTRHVASSYVPMLRGIAYLSYVLSNVPESDHDPEQHRLALTALGEMTAFAARLAEHEQDASDEQKLRSLRIAEVLAS